jgi:DNA polymerase III delta prime subunit
MEEIIEQFISDGEIGTDCRNDYRHDSTFHETIIDKYYNLEDAVTLINDLNRYEETDSGIWESLEPEEAIGAKAAWTYGNAVKSMCDDLLEQISGDIDIEEIDKKAVKQMVKWMKSGKKRFTQDEREYISIEGITGLFNDDVDRQELFNDLKEIYLEKEIEELLEK